jgi:hypothetical protein
MSIPIYITGVRPGEFILGTGKQNKGSLIQIHGIYPSCETAVLEQNYAFFRDNLTHIRFKDMTVEQRKMDLLAHSTFNDDLYLSDLNINIIPYRLCGEKLDNIPFHSVMQSIQVIYNNIPGKIGSKARRHTLVFRPSIWTLYQPTSITMNIDEIPVYQVDENIKHKLRNWTPGMLKSLLQKIIRSGSGAEYINDVFFILARHPGSFVPDLQKFVSGFQSAYKRLAISLLEDSYIDEELATYLMKTAMIEDPIQQQQLSRGITDQLYSAFKYGKDSRRLIWTTKVYYPSDHPLLKNLEMLKSFQSDINMVSSIIYNKFSYTDHQFVAQPLCLAHSLDHHCCPFIWYMDNVDDTDRETYYKKLWDQNSKYNVRDGFKELHPRPVQVILEKFFDEQFYCPKFNKQSSVMQFEPYNIAGLAGDKSDGNDIYFMDPRDPDHIMHIPRLTRDNKEVQIKNNTAPEHIIKYFAKYKQNNIITRTYPIISYDNNALSITSLLCRSSGVMVDADDILVKLCKSINIHRLLFHCHEWCDVIDFNTDIDHPADPSVFQFLIKVVGLYPSALHYDGATRFKVDDAYLFHYIIKLIKKQIKNNYNIWKTEITLDNRKLWPHQEQALATLMSRKKNIIWIPVGLGKTLIVIRYIIALQQAKLLPEYILYSMPKSAFDSVIRELSTHGLNITYNQMTPGSICIVEHDQLRKLNFEQPCYSQCLFIMDELHKALNKTIRTSQALRLAKLCRYFVGMTGTIINTSSDLDDILQWLRPFTDFPVNVSNTYTAIASLIAYRMDLAIQVNRTEVITDEYSVSDKFDLHHEVEKAYQSIYTAMNNYLLNSDEPLFIIIRKKADLSYFDTTNCFIIGDNSITWTPQDKHNYRAVFTTVQHSTGYTLTGLNTMLTSVYFSNNMTREQLEGRLIRLGQTRPVNIITFHCGILSHILRRYDRIRNFSKAVKQIATNIDM